MGLNHTADVTTLAVLADEKGAFRLSLGLTDDGQFFLFEPDSMQVLAGASDLTIRHAARRTTVQVTLTMEDDPLYIQR